MKIYSAKYLIKLREACSYYNIHLIADESQWDLEEREKCLPVSTAV